MRKSYPTDLSDAEWSYIEPHLPAPTGHGRPRTHSLREILNAVFYLLKSGCQWRLLPHDFPRWPTVYHYFRKWRLDGTWERINRAIRERLRVRLKRDPQPSAGVVDSQGRSRVPRRAENSAVTTEARRSKVASATYWWTRRASYSWPKSTQCQGDGLRRDQDATASSTGAISSPLSSVAGRWLPWRGQGQGLGREGLGMERGSPRAPAQGCPRRGPQVVGQRVGK